GASCGWPAFQARLAPRGILRGPSPSAHPCFSGNTGWRLRALRTSASIRPPRRDAGSRGRGTAPAGTGKSRLRLTINANRSAALLIHADWWICSSLPLGLGRPTQFGLATAFTVPTLGDLRRFLYRECFCALLAALRAG